MLDNTQYYCLITHLLRHHTEHTSNILLGEHGEY